MSRNNTASLKNLKRHWASRCTRAVILVMLWLFMLLRWWCCWLPTFVVSYGVTVDFVVVVLVVAALGRVVDCGWCWEWWCRLFFFWFLNHLEWRFDVKCFFKVYSCGMCWERNPCWCVGGWRSLTWHLSGLESWRVAWLVDIRRGTVEACWLWATD